MKKLVLLMSMIILLISCGSSMTVNGKTYECYGYFDRDEVKKKEMNYYFVKKNLFPIIIFSETILAPVLILGYTSHCPSGLKK